MKFLPTGVRPIFHPVISGRLVGQACATHCCSRLDHIGVQAGGRDLIRDVSLHLHCGELIAIVGPNGGGKSTLLRALIGEIPYSGKIEFLDAQGKVYLSPRLGYVPQNPRFDPGMPVTVLDLFAATLSKFPVWLGNRRPLRQRTLEVLAAVDADFLVDRRVGELSGGELQRVLLALALEPKPNLLLLDEPVSGVDANGRRLFYQVVDRVRKTFDLAILLVSHDFRELTQVADRMVLLNGSIQCVGKPREVFSHERFVELFGRDFQ